jgi:P pilus assembly chaperone PapD
MNYAEVIIKANYTFFYYHQLQPTAESWWIQPVIFIKKAREKSAQTLKIKMIRHILLNRVEAPEGTKDSFFMVTPPLFRLEGKQTNTVRVFPNAYISKAPQDREKLIHFNVMSIPPTSDSEADKTSCSSPFATECASSIVHALFRI